MNVDCGVAETVLEGCDEGDCDAGAGYLEIDTYMPNFKSINIRIILPISLQVFLYASKAASVSSPHASLIASWT